jgi:hypothetical protein
MRATEGVLLGNACDRERLARESSQQEIVCGNRIRIENRDVLREWMVRPIGEVRFVGLPTAD